MAKVNENWEATYFMRAYYTGEITEDGESVIGEAFDVFVINEDGECFYHKEVIASPCRATFETTKAKAERLVARVQAAIDAGIWAGPRNNPHWSKGRPAYGSKAYANNWQEYEAEDIRWERESEGYYN